MSALKQLIEKRTGWLLGHYVCNWPVYRGVDKLTAPVVAAGYTACGTGGVNFRNDIYLVVGPHGFYLCRGDGYERALEKRFAEIEKYANSTSGRTNP